MKILFTDTNLCTGCRNCELACSYRKSKTFKRKNSNIWVDIFPQERFISVQTCLQCEDAPCMDVCPTKALQRDPRTNAVIFYEDRCIHCSACIQACPFGNIYYKDSYRLIEKCDLCGGQPACVMFCQCQALSYIEVDQISLDKRKRMVSDLSQIILSKAEKNR